MLFLPFPLLSIIENSPPLEWCPQDGVEICLVLCTYSLPFPNIPATFPQQTAIRKGFKYILNRYK